MYVYGKKSARRDKGEKGNPMWVQIWLLGPRNPNLTETSPTPTHISYTNDPKPNFYKFESITRAIGEGEN